MILFANFHFILVLAAIIPAAALLIYVYKEDRLEKEPPGLIIKLVVMGAVSTLLASITEQIGMSILESAFYENSFAYRALLYFVVVAFSEEGFKYLVLKVGTWRNPEFNCKFDGVVYAVAVSLRSLGEHTVRPGLRLFDRSYQSRHRGPRACLLRRADGRLVRSCQEERGPGLEQRFPTCQGLCGSLPGSGPRRL